MRTDVIGMSHPTAPPQPPSVPAPAFDPGTPAPPPPQPGAVAPAAPIAPAAQLIPPAIPLAVATAPAAPAPAAGATAPAAPAEAIAPPAQFLLPTDAATMLNAGAALTHVSAQLEEPPSVIQAAEGAPVHRLDAGAAPVAIGGVTAATAADLADRAAAAPAPSPTPMGESTWWSPANALVFAVAALTWQFISFYAREQLPGVKASGADLRGFDSLVNALPLAASHPGRFVGVALAACAIGILFQGTRRGLREPVLQGIVGAVCALSLVLIVALPALHG